MRLHFGKDKCVKMHIGKNHNTNICSDTKFDAWKDQLIEGEDGQWTLKDEYLGAVKMT